MINSINNEEEYKAALAEAQKRWNDDSNNNEELSKLITLIEEYEEKHYPIK